MIQPIPPVFPTASAGGRPQHGRGGRGRQKGAGKNDDRKPTGARPRGRGGKKEGAGAEKGTRAKETSQSSTKAAEERKGAAFGAHKKAHCLSAHQWPGKGDGAFPHAAP